MSRGRNDEALAVFQFIYKVNHKNSSEKYPVSVTKDLFKTEINFFYLRLLR